MRPLALLERLLQLVPVLLGISLVVFAMMRATPGDPVELMLGDALATPEQRESLRRDMGLDRPLPERFLHFLGNKLFSLAFSWLLGQPIKDTLCGTKALWRTDYERIAAGRSYFGEYDPFGDFDLLFGAAKLHLKIVDLPIRYRERTYGTTSISRWQHGWLLLRMLATAARRLFASKDARRTGSISAAKAAA